MDKKAVKKDVETFKKFIKLNPNDANAYGNLGVAYGKLGKYKEAIKAYKHAIKLEPDFAGAHYNLGATCLMLHDRDSALEEYKILRNLDPKMANELLNFIYKKGQFIIYR